MSRFCYSHLHNMKLIIEGAMIVLVTGFFAMLEASLFTVSLSRARVLASQKKMGGAALLRVKQSMARSIFLLVVFMNISTVIGSILVGQEAANHFAKSVALISILMTLAIILFGELIPKSIGIIIDGVPRSVACPILATG